jgi:hypothetical protein
MVMKMMMTRRKRILASQVPTIPPPLFMNGEMMMSWLSSVCRGVELLQLRRVNEELLLRLASMESEADDGREAKAYVRELAEKLKQKDQELAESKKVRGGTHRTPRHITPIRKAEAQLRALADQTDKVKRELASASGVCVLKILRLYFEFTDTAIAAANNDERVRQLEREVSRLKAEREKLVTDQQSNGHALQTTEQISRERSDLAVQLQRAKIEVCCANIYE